MAVAASLLVGAVVLGAWLVLEGPGSGAGSVPRFEMVEASTPGDIEIVIPPGTATRLASGEPVDAVPRLIEPRVGDVIVVRNEDVDAAFLGPFFVPAGQTIAHQALSTGVLEGSCSAHEDGRITVVVRA